MHAGIRTEPAVSVPKASSAEPSSGAVASDRQRNRAEPEIVGRDRVADNAAVDPQVAVGIRDVRHQRRGQAQRRRGDHVGGVETRRHAPRQRAKPRKTREVICRTDALSIAHRRRDDRIELRQPARQSPVEDCAARWR
jgi:hypothetical protein